MIICLIFMCDDGIEVDVFIVVCEGFDGIGVVVGVEDGFGLLWIDWVYEGEVSFV